MGGGVIVSTTPLYNFLSLPGSDNLNAIRRDHVKVETFDFHFLSLLGLCSTFGFTYFQVNLLLFLENSIFFFTWPRPWHMDVPGSGVGSELQL